MQPDPTRVWLTQASRGLPDAEGPSEGCEKNRDTSSRCHAYLRACASSAKELLYAEGGSKNAAVSESTGNI